MPCEGATHLKMKKIIKRIKELKDEWYYHWEWMLHYDCAIACVKDGNKLHAKRHLDELEQLKNGSNEM